jgi:hypothetical protein
MFSWSLSSSRPCCGWLGPEALCLRFGRESGVPMFVRAESAWMVKPISWISTVAPFSCPLGEGAEEMGGEGARPRDGPAVLVGVVVKSSRLLGPGLDGDGGARVAPLIPKLRGQLNCSRRTRHGTYLVESSTNNLRAGLFPVPNSSKDKAAFASGARSLLFLLIVSTPPCSAETFLAFVDEDSPAR